MRVYDIYDILLHTGKGQLGGNIQGNGLILYGRIGKELSPLPQMLTKKYASDLMANGYKLFTFDIFAVQPNDTEVFASEGRIAVLCDRGQREYETTAISCKLYYNRIMDTQSLEANLVIGCYFVAVDSSTYSIKPVLRVSRSQFAIKAYEKQLFIDGLVRPEQLSGLASGTLPRKLGNECPILSGRTTPLPVFYEMTVKGDFVFRQSLRQFYNMLEYPNLAESYDNWSLSPELNAFLGYSDVLKREQSTKTFLEFKELPDIVTHIQTKLGEIESVFNESRNKFLSDVPSGYSSRFDELSERVYSLLYDNWLGSELGKTGKQYVKAMVRVLVTNSDTDLRRVENEIDSIISDSSAEELLGTLFKEEDETELSKFLSKMGMKPYKTLSLLSFIWATLGLRCKFATILEMGKSADTILYLILRQPYSLTYIAPSIGISALDMLACFTGNASDMQSVIPLRSIAYLHSVLSSPDNGSLLVERTKLGLTSGYSLSAREFTTYQETGSLLNEMQCWISKLLFGSEIDNTLIRGEVMQSYGNSYTISIGVDTDTVVGYYLNSGMGMSINHSGKAYLMDYDIAMQFVYCVSRLQEQFLLDYNMPDPETMREKYESKKGIRLEEEQAIAVKLLKHSHTCLTGSAGSGKTTTLDYLLYCLQEGCGVSADEILLLAPTGMAAKRMRECTGHIAYTIHSGLKIFNTSVSWATRVRPSADFKYRVVVVDETSMISLSLMYHLLKRIPDDIPILFIGDIAQLPPIDYGKPFADMLSFLPHVCLKTIKRASQDSGIIANCSNLLAGNPNLVSTRDTKVIPLKEDESVVETVADICKVLTGVSEFAYSAELTNPDGTNVRTSAGCIQVVSPVSKSAYTWSTIRLNDKLQDVFNPRRKGQNRIVYQDSARNDIELRVGDRVINSSNDHEAFRYEKVADDTLVRLKSSGILNGEMGIVVDIRDSRDFNFLIKGEDDNLVPDSESLSMMTASSRYTKVLVLVEYPDIEGRNFIVAYCGLLEGVFKNGIKLTSSYDLTHLSLAYAVTVHKMQGNQADFIIAPIFKTKARGFISRNLVNTAWSRAKKGLFIIGDVQGANSAVGSAIRVEALDQRLSPFDL